MNLEASVQKILTQIRALTLRIFAENAVGVYVHGSLALGCFQWDHSDIDLIVVLEAAPAQVQKEDYIAGILDINKTCPPKGLEMSVVLEQYTRHFVYPTPFELHFSNAHLKQCSRDIKEYCRYMNGTDKDLAAHFTIIKSAGITLCGKPAEKVFGEVPRAAYLDSIRSDIEDAEQNILQDPVYTILNLCRVLAYQEEGLILSKKEGGEWGMAHAEAPYVKAIEEALNRYRSPILRRMEIDEERLAAFAKYMLCRIFTA